MAIIHLLKDFYFISYGASQDLSHLYHQHLVLGALSCLGFRICVWCPSMLSCLSCFPFSFDIFKEQKRSEVGCAQSLEDLGVKNVVQRHFLKFSKANPLNFKKIKKINNYINPLRDDFKFHFRDQRFEALTTFLMIQKWVVFSFDFLASSPEIMLPDIIIWEVWAFPCRFLCCRILELHVLETGSWLNLMF